MLDPFVSLSTKLGVTPDAISTLAFVVAAAAGGAYYLAGDAALWYFGGAVLVALNGWLDILDGAVAREMGTDSKAGDLLDHVLDRYADIVIVAGLAAGIDRYGIGLAAVTGVLMTSYLGTQSQAVGLDRVYGGMLGRADRLALIGIVTAIAAFVDVTLAGFGLVGVLLIVFAVVGHVTALQRFWGAWRALS
ncbi:CDP-alcohol phosphatidyltransferase family protein [Natronoarchaeum mannanilyticum]|uniref:CDP-alcohol phosphatidyltransferase family protein n=2 Tax=Natronoarchaeum mannanilyticum TaxID=926360 RepID=A0AAV3TCL4_9EURY